MKPFDFANDPALSRAIGARMQAAANRRAAQGFVSPDGTTHLSAECRDLYDAGHSLLSNIYRAATMRAQKGKI